MESQEILIKKFFEEESFVNSDIQSFDNFLDTELHRIIESNKEIEPSIIPPNVEEFKIKFDKVRITLPEIIEADGSKRTIFPSEARLRRLTYSAPVFIKTSAHINGAERETFETQIGNIPIMLRSKNCHLHGLSREELIEKGEDPDDPGGYFIINGTEKVIVKIEDLAPNRFTVEKSRKGVYKSIGTIFSGNRSHSSPHKIEYKKDGIFYLSTNIKKPMPIVIVIKALGMTKDEEIFRMICEDDHFQEIYFNILDAKEIKTEEQAMDYIAKEWNISQAKEIRIDRVKMLLDDYLLLHLGSEESDRLKKAQNMCKMIRKQLLVTNGEIPADDKDHYMNKRLKLSGDLLADLIRVNIKTLINDLNYNFQRIVKRGKFPTLKAIIREKMLTSKIYSAMATGNWVGGRKGVSQRIQRLNFLETVSHLQRVISPLSATQENFDARALHCTHLGRLCPIETPEGTNIGLKKNLALLATVSLETEEENLMKNMEEAGLEKV